jgi:CHAT domain-containing protein
LLSQLALFYGSINALDSAVYYHQQACECRLNLNDSHAMDDLYMEASSYKQMGERDKAIELIRYIISVRKPIYEIGNDEASYTMHLSDVYFMLFILYMSDNDFTNQIQVAKDYLSLFDVSSGHYYFEILNGLFKALLNINDYEEAIKYGEFAVQIMRKTYGDQSKELTKMLYNLSLACLEGGYLVKGIEIGQQAIQRINSFTNKYSEDYITCLNCNANYYSYIGQIDKCIDYRTQALNIASELYGEDSSEAAMIIHNIAVEYSEKGDLDKAIELGKKVVSLRRQTLGKQHYLYARSLGNLSNNLSRRGDYKEALNGLNERLKIEKEQYGDSSIIVASRLIDIGTTYGEINDTINEGIAYKASLGIINKLRGRINPVSNDVVRIKELITDYLFKNRYYSDCSYLLCEELTCLRQQIMTDLSKTQERNRDIIWKNARSSFLQQLPRLVLATHNDSLISMLYDYSILFGKGLLLHSHNAIAQIVMRTDSIKRLYNEINLLKELRETELSKNIVNRQYDIEELNERINTIEKSLLPSNDDETFFKNYLSITWKDVQSQLKDEDLVVEFFSVQYPSNLSDSVLYFALTLKKGYKYPKIVQLFNLKDIPDWKSTHLNQLYDYIWKPLSSELNSVRNVFFSTWYSLNMIPIESIMTPSGQYMSDIYNMYRLSSTRELVTYRVKEPITRIAIYGGLDYECSIDKNDTKTNDTVSEKPSLYRGVLDVANERGGVDYLPYTLEEAHIIDKEANEIGIESFVFTGSKGTEDSFKALTSSNIDAIHVATHGYYYNEKEASVEGAKKNLLFLYQNEETPEEKVLNRSFLIMSGGNRLSRRETIPEGSDDGILTAKEISRLNLHNVDLIVLSSCQSGLGESSSEGTMGLQQGFKKAGVKTIVMALDNVDDKASRLFMEKFYKEMFSGKSKRESLVNAQEYLRKVENGKYDNPKYWASFIMLDGLN